MPQPTPPAADYRPPDLSSRGFMSCFTWGEHPEGPISAETMSLLQDLFFDLYHQAFSRLPIQHMSDLELDIHTSGLCVGLLDPVSNIILNTISFLPAGLAASSPPSGHRGTLRQISLSRTAWYPMVYLSISIMIGFMRLYFRFLNEEQAGRYLLWARGDLALAVLFVEQELYFDQPTIPDPRSPRTQFSFQLAAMEACHPAPDYLAKLSTLWLPKHHLDTLAAALSTWKLGVDAVLDISRVLYSQATAPPRTPFSQGPVHRAKYDLGDGRIGYTNIIQLPGDYITYLRNHLDTQPMLSNYREDAIHATLHNRRRMYGLTDTWESCEKSNPPGEATCLYIRSLKMVLHGMIHGFYLKALAKFSAHDARRLVRAMVVAGHCYGPLDPVSNIILTTIWYETKFPFPNSLALGGYDTLDTLAPGEHDILDTLSLLRIECRSLVGLVSLFCDTVCEQSFHYTLKSLCLMKCDLSVEVQRYSRELGAVSPNPFAPATEAAQHPQSSALAEFLFSLSCPLQLDRLRHLLSTNSKLSGDSLRQIREMVGCREPSRPEQLPLNHTALDILSGKRSDYAEQQNFVRKKIMQLLQKYAYQHPMEPKYELVCICALEAIGHTEMCYHVNFMAATDAVSENTLFFAEFWVSYGDQSKKSFCCPVPLPCTGRCYYGEVSATKIVYPDMIDYFSCDVTSGGVAQTETTRDTDFIFHDLGRDSKLIEILKRQSEEQKAVQRGLYISEELLQGAHCEAPEWWNNYEVPAAYA